MFYLQYDLVLCSPSLVTFSVETLLSVLGQPFVKRFTLCCRSSYRCLFCLFVCVSVTVVYCGQTAGWIKMPLGTEVGIGQSHILLDGDSVLPVPPPNKGVSEQSPIFSPCPLWPYCRPSQQLVSSCLQSFFVQVYRLVVLYPFQQCCSGIF